MPLINALEARQKSKENQESAAMERINTTQRFIEQFIVPKIAAAIDEGVSKITLKIFDNLDFELMTLELRNNGYRTDYSRARLSPSSTYGFGAKDREITINISWA